MAELKSNLDKIARGDYGTIVRSKGIIQGDDLKWYVFNLTMQEVSIEQSKAIPIGKVVIIGSHANLDEVKKLF